MRLSFVRLALAFACVISFTSVVAPAQTLTNLYNYDLTYSGTTCNLGANFYGNLVQASDGNIYGTFLSCGANNGTTSNYGGGIFKIIPSTGAYSVVYSCNAAGTDCDLPDGIIELPDGNLYGTSLQGCANGFGCIFKVGLNGSNYTVLHSFNNTSDGAYPQGALIFNTTGSFGGTIYGCNQGDGTTTFGSCWQYAPDLGSGIAVFSGLFTESTSAPEGYQPVFSGLTQINGNFYGTTQLGGSGGNGTLFYYNPTSNVITVLEPFSGGTAGSFPSGTPKLYSDNYIYGTTLSNYPEPGNPNNGSVWKAGLTSGFTALADLNTTVDYNPIQAVSFDTAGNILFIAEGDGYNTPTDLGEIFLEPRAGGSTSLQTLYTFTQNSSEGGEPQTTPFFDNQGHMWTAQLVGGGEGIGSIDEWSLSTETAPPITITATPATVAPNILSTIAWSSNNSFSDNEKFCFGSGNSNTNWNTTQVGTYASGILSGSRTVSFATTGDYPFAITCGGVESALTTLHVRYASATTLQASANPVTAGGSETFTVRVTGNGTAATGTVALVLNGGVIASIPLVNGVGSLGVATTGLPSGTYTLVASYPGDTQYSASSGSLAVTVNGIAATTTTLTATPNPVGQGQNVTLAATVARLGVSGVPTGSVEFLFGTSVLTTAAVNGSGVATFVAPTSTLGPATYPITAMYLGDANDSASTSAAVNVVVKDATTSVFTITPGSTTVGQPVTFKTVVSATAGGTPTGTVVYTFNGGILLSEPLSAGMTSVSVPTTGLPASTYTITATYGGDTLHAGSTTTATVTLH